MVLWSAFMGTGAAGALVWTVATALRPHGSPSRRALQTAGSAMTATSLMAVSATVSARSISEAARNLTIMLFGLAVLWVVAWRSPTRKGHAVRERGSAGDDGSS